MITFARVFPENLPSTHNHMLCLGKLHKIFQFYRTEFCYFFIFTCSILMSIAGKGKSSEKAKAEPSKVEMHRVAVDILKEVDFNKVSNVFLCQFMYLFSFFLILYKFLFLYFPWCRQLYLISSGNLVWPIPLNSLPPPKKMGNDFVNSARL